MGYQDLYNDAVKAKTVKEMGAKYKEFKKDGDNVIGRLLHKNQVQSRQGGVPYNQYLFDTDEGKVKFALGSATDGDAAAMMGIGGIYAVTYHGKEKLSTGRTMNKFSIGKIQSPPENPVGGEADVPF